MTHSIALTENPWLIPAFLIIATVYSAAGFGGGSSYLAFLGMVSGVQEVIRPLAYLCNSIVTGFSTVQYRKRQWLKWRDLLPFIIGSVPFAFFGGMLRLDNSIYLVLLGCSLLISAFLLLVKRRSVGSALVKRSLNRSSVRFLLSAIIGILSGTVGIGGGVFLSPVLHLAKWRSPKEIAAISAGFILANAIAGATGYLCFHPVQVSFADASILGLTVLIGAFLGLRFNFTEAGQRWIRRITGFLLLLIAIRLIWENLYGTII